MAYTFARHEDIISFAFPLSHLATAALANPIATPPPDKEATIAKTWEKCLISTGPNSATVSCAVGYLAKNFLNYDVSVSVPIFFQKGTVNNPERLANLVKARLETGGKVLEPIWISVGGYSGIPGVLLGECKFLVGRVPDKEFAIVVSYEQPAINGQICYMPLFEGGRSPEFGNDFTVTFRRRKTQREQEAPGQPATQSRQAKE